MQRGTSHITALCLTAGLLAAGCEYPTSPTTYLGNESSDADNLGDPTTDRILVDASHDGGVWWFPQWETYDPSADHQGKRFADYLRDRGFGVDELGRDVVLTDSLLSDYTVVIRAGEWGGYQPSELEAYGRFLERETTLVLLSDHRLTDPSDELAEMLGVTFADSVSGPVTRVAQHPVTSGALNLYYAVGARVADFDHDRVEILGWVGDVPVMGTVQYGSARIFFLGDTNTIQAVPQPFVDDLLDWMTQ